MRAQVFCRDVDWKHSAAVGGRMLIAFVFCKNWTCLGWQLTPDDWEMDNWKLMSDFHCTWVTIRDGAGEWSNFTELFQKLLFNDYQHRTYEWLDFFKIRAISWLILFFIFCWLQIQALYVARVLDATQFATLWQMANDSSKRASTLIVAPLSWSWLSN